MGLFDYVKHEEPCTKCGAPLRNWQTKDAECYLNELDPEDVPIGGTYYAFCDNCRLRVTYYKRPTGFTLERAIKEWR